MPAAAIASVTAATRCAPAARTTCSHSAGWTCRPSVTSSTVTRSSSSSATTGPGSRWCSGRHRVEQVGAVPGARRDRRAGQREVGVGVPDRGHRTRPRRPGGWRRARRARSGARVTMRDHARGQQRRPARPGRGRAAARGRARRSGPRRATAPPGARPRSPRRRRARRARPPSRRSSSGAAATRLASVVVVPCARWNADRAQRLLGVAARERRPGPAVHVDVDEARARARRAQVAPSPRRAARRARRATIRSPSICSQPGPPTPAATSASAVTGLTASP